MNILRGLPNQWPISTLWSIHILPNQSRGNKTPCAILFGNDLRIGLHIFVLSILKRQNAKTRSLNINKEKICEFIFISMIKALL